MKAALDVLSTDVDEKISDTKEYVDSKLLIPQLNLGTRTLKIINSGKVNMEYRVMYDDNYGTATKGQTELDCIAGPSGTLVYGKIPGGDYGTMYGSRSYNFSVELKPVNGFVAAACSGYNYVYYFSYISDRQISYKTGGVIHAFSEGFETIGFSYNNYLQAYIMARTTEGFQATTNYDNVVTSDCYVMINFPGFLCLN